MCEIEFDFDNPGNLDYVKNPLDLILCTLRNLFKYNHDSMIHYIRYKPDNFDNRLVNEFTNPATEEFMRDQEGKQEEKLEDVVIETFNNAKDPMDIVAETEFNIPWVQHDSTTFEERLPIEVFDSDTRQKLLFIKAIDERNYELIDFYLTALGWNRGFWRTWYAPIYYGLSAEEHHNLTGANKWITHYSEGRKQAINLHLVKEHEYLTYEDLWKQELFPEMKNRNC